MQETGGLYAAIRFPGIVDDSQLDSKQKELVALMTGDSLLPGDSYLLLRYNDPSVPAAFRRNEVLIPIVGGFELWET